MDLVSGAMPGQNKLFVEQQGILGGRRAGNVLMSDKNSN